MTTQDSLPAAGQALPDGLSTRRVPTKGFKLTSCSLSSSSKLSWRKVKALNSPDAQERGRLGNLGRLLSNQVAFDKQILDRQSNENHDARPCAVHLCVAGRISTQWASGHYITSTGLLGAMRGWRVARGVVGLPSFAAVVDVWHTEEQRRQSAEHLRKYQSTPRAQKAGAGHTSVPGVALV